jgi:hypothetical protein
MPTKQKPPPERIRVTLMLPPAVVKQAKHHAIDVDRDLQDVVADAITEHIERAATRKKAGA